MKEYRQRICSNLPREQSGPKAIILIILVAHVLLIIFLSVSKGKLHPWMYRKAFTGKTYYPRAAYMENLDNLFKSSFPEGNLFINYKNLTTSGELWLIQDTRVRAAYNIYPRQVFVAPPGIPLLSSEDVLAHNNLPDDKWLRQHGITNVMTFRKTKQGPKVDIRKVR